MILHQLGRLVKGQRGFTLIEVIVALAVTGIIGVGAATTTGQLLTQGSRNRDYTTASQQVMNAIHWVARDAQMSQSVVPGGPAGFPLVLGWTQWDNSEHEVTYSIVGDQLRRSYSIDGGEPRQTVVAQYINPAPGNTTAAFADRVLTVKVTATVGAGSRAVSMSKVREVTPRPGL